MTPEEGSLRHLKSGEPNSEIELAEPSTYRQFLNAPSPASCTGATLARAGDRPSWIPITFCHPTQW
jgi:hypothetical protein